MSVVQVSATRTLRGVAAEHRRVVAETSAHAQALAQNLAKQEFVVETQTVHEWLLRRRRRRGDITVAISIRQPERPGQPLATPPSPVAPSPWDPPRGRPAG